MSFSRSYFSYGAILVYIATGILAYQFDVDNVITYENPTKNQEFRGSYFGYSVALWNSSSEKASIFIGAPRANSTAYQKIFEPGTVYKCEIGQPCSEWVVDRIDRTAPQDRSWLGGTIKLGKYQDTDIVVVCAPGWLDKNVRSWLMSGMCYRAEASEFSSSQQEVGMAFGPLDDTEAYFNKALYFAMGQSGFSAYIIPDPDYLRYVFGCPGVYLWQGTLIFGKTDDVQTSFNTPNPIVDWTANSFDYSGYAVTSGFYFSPTKRMYVSGAPRSEDLRGKIILSDFLEAENANKITGIHKTGVQVGEYFGSALASCDIDGDKRDDLLVGAPQWSKDSDEGRVYVFSGISKGKSMKFMDRQIIEGKTYRGRFGFAITCLGDIDYDGYHDVAIGAPYDGNGAVYIFHGSKDGLKYTQKISAPKETKGFGFSISEPSDIDNNDYADIAVGAYLSGHVTVFRSKRVVSMKVTLSTDLSGETLRWDAKSFAVIICSSYRGEHAPQELNVIKELKIDEISQRAEINIERNRQRIYTFNDTLQKLSTSCQNFTISMKEKKENTLNPLKLSVTQRLHTNKKNGTLLVKQNGTNGNDYFCNSSAVMNEIHQEIHAHLQIPFAIDCGNDSICNSNLSIRMITDLKDGSRYVIGSASYIELHIVVTNTGDQAYFTKAHIFIPMFIKLYFIPSTCTKAEMSNKITCDIDNPLNNNETKNVTLVLDMSHVPSDTEKIDLNATVTTQSNDTASGDHKTSIAINCMAETDIGIAGQAVLDLYSYTLLGGEEQLPTITFQHTYEIKNYEVTPITEALLSISIPTHWMHGGNKIEVVRVNKITSDLNGQTFYCTDRENNMGIGSVSYDAFTMTEQLIGNNKTFDASLDNRTLYINCTNSSFKWKTITCKLENFTSAQSVAKLDLAFDLLLQNFTPEIIQNKDIIFFVTNASTIITKPLGSTRTVNNRPDSILIGTKFIGSPPIYHLAAWIIPLSVSVGLLLLIFVILGLLKLGFFKRSKKMALLKEKENLTPKVVLETTSSREALDLT